MVESTAPATFKALLIGSCLGPGNKGEAFSKVRIRMRDEEAKEDLPGVKHDIAKMSKLMEIKGVQTTSLY